MNLVLSSAVLSAILVPIPEPSSVPAEALGELILEDRASQPVADQTLLHPQALRPGSLLVLNERAIRRGELCLRKQWRVRLTPTGNASDTEAWWVNRKKGIRSQRQIVLAAPSGECPRDDYADISNSESTDLGTAAWGLARYRAFLNDEAAIDYRCVTQEALFVEACSDVEALRKRLSEKTPVHVASDDQRVRIRIDSISDAEIDLTFPYRLTIKLHRPVPF